MLNVLAEDVGGVLAVLAAAERLKGVPLAAGYAEVGDYLIALKALGLVR